MKHLYNKNLKLRKNLFNLTFKYYLIKLLVNNNFLNTTLKFNLLILFYNVFSKFSFIKIINKCFISFNKKRFNKSMFYSRFIYLKKIVNGCIFGIFK